MPECTRMYLPEFTRMYQDMPFITRMYQDMPFIMYHNVLFNYQNVPILAFKFIRMYQKWLLIYQNVPSCAFNLQEYTKICLFNLPECTITRMYLDVPLNLPKKFSLLMALASMMTIYVIIDLISTE